MYKKLFIGIKIYPVKEFLDFYSILKQKLDYENIRWVSIENMHITLEFLGQTKIAQIPEIEKSLYLIVKRTKAFQIQIKGLGVFRKKNRTNVLWLGVSNNEILNDLANKVIEEMKNLGFESESRPYIPHLTLGRVKGLICENDLNKMLDKYDNQLLQVSKIENVIIYESTRTQKGLEYKILKMLSLRK